jgi:amino acid transporter
MEKLNLLDLTFAGYGSIIGITIFSLLPYIIRYSGGRVWMAFLIGGVISMLTGLSYARLTLDNASNDSEYVWIMDTFGVKGDDETSRRRNKYVKWFANIVIWFIVLLGITMNSTIVVGATKFINIYKHNIPDFITNFGIIALPTFINMLGVGTMSTFNIGITSLITFGLLTLVGIAGKYHTYAKDLTLLSGGSNMIKAIFMTILPFNGFQSVAHLGESANKISDIPKGIIGSMSSAIIVYVAVAAATVAIIGVKAGGLSVSPIADAYSTMFGSGGSNIVNALAIGNAIPTLLILIYSRANIITSLANKKAAPDIFKNIKLSLIIVGIFTYICTFAPGDALEVLTNTTNIITVSVFSIINGIVLYKYHNNKWSKPLDDPKDERMIAGFKKMYPYYAVLGVIVSIMLMGKLALGK